MNSWTIQAVAIFLTEKGMLGMLVTMPPALLMTLGLKSKGRWTAFFAGGLFLSMACFIAGTSLEGIETGVGLALSKSTLMVHAADEPTFFWASTAAFLAIAVALFLLGCFVFWRGFRPVNGK